MALNLEDVDLNGGVDEAIEMVGYRSEMGSDNSQFVVPRRLPTAQCDRARCREILLNLLSDALKSNDKPRTLVEVGYISPGESHARPGCPKDQAGRTIYDIKDNGIGIQAKRYDHVFKMLKRLH